MSETVTVTVEPIAVASAPSKKKSVLALKSIFSNKTTSGSPWPTPPGGGKTVVEFGDDHRKRDKQKSGCCCFRR